MTTKTAPAPEVVDVEANEVPVTNAEQAERTLKHYMYWSMGFGLIPLPLVDIAAITGTQIKMVASMSEIYGIKFSEHRVKNIVTPLVASVGLTPIAAGILGSLVKIIPFVGTAIGALSMPVVAGATTYAVGKVFIMHFESGGTLLDLDPKSVKEYYQRMFQEGTKVAEEIKAKEEADKSKKSV